MRRIYFAGSALLAGLLGLMALSYPTFDCLPATCPQINLATAADPSITFDGSAHWMSYSVPYNIVPGVSVVDVRLARSSDDGANWTPVGTLWKAAPAVNPDTGVTDFLSYEISNIWIESGMWYAVRFEYLRPLVGPIYSQIGRHSYLAVSAGVSPQEVATSVPQLLGSRRTSDAYAPVRLNDLHADLAECDVWIEPALLKRNDTLFLAARCMRFTDSGEPLHGENFYALFSTIPQGPVGEWLWRYEGKFLTSDEAASLGDYTFFSQMDFVDQNRIIVSPARAGGVQGEYYDGSRVLVLESLTPPRLKKRPWGALVVQATVVASDLAENGTGSSAYEPSSNMGIVLARKKLEEPSFTLHRTGVKP